MLSNVTVRDANSSYYVKPTWINNLEDFVNLPISAIGFLLNILSIIIWSSKEMTSTTGMYLVSVAVYDAVHLLVQGIVPRLMKMLQFHNSNVSFMIFVLIIYIVNFTSKYGSTFTTVALTADRTIGVTLPLKWASMCTPFRVKSVTASVLFLSVVMVLPNVIRLMMGFHFIDSDADYYEFVLVFVTIITPAVTIGLPVITITVLNIMIVKSLRKRGNETGSLRSSITGSRRRRRTTKKITAQVIVISIITLVHLTLQIYKMLIEYIDYRSLYVVKATADFVGTINHSVNFFLYCLFGQKFRQCFIRLFKQRCFKCCK